MNYKQQLAVVEGLSLQSDIQTRMDCPFCNGRNTFSVDTTEGNLNWYCFHASCSAKGKKQGEKNMQYVERVFHGNQELHIEDVNFKIPMTGSIASLNVSVACGIAIHKLMSK